MVRSLVTETRLTPGELIAPLFVVPGKGVKDEIPSLPGQYRYSPDTLAEHAGSLYDRGVKAVLLFGIPESKDDSGLSACDPNGIVQRAVTVIKEKHSQILVCTDLCFCEYTTHGHCGIIKDGQIDNDATLPLLAEQALSHAKAGSDLIAPSGMIDGAVKTIRHALDQNGFTHLPIMSYAAKYASAFYGPFRDAVQSAPQFGDRRTHQMNPANSREAVAEVFLDVEEGADIVMVKPALAYLDVIHKVKSRFQMPTAAYNVSGEYAMVKAAAQKGLLDEQKVMLEMLISIKRAGADIVITYFADEFARLYAQGLPEI